jgi:hypothetical protein
VTDLVIVCPNHAGSFDCTPFCELCEGNQEFNLADYLLEREEEAYRNQGKHAQNYSLYLNEADRIEADYWRGYSHALLTLHATLRGPTPLPSEEVREW